MRMKQKIKMMMLTNTIQSAHKLGKESEASEGEASTCPCPNDVKLSADFDKRKIMAIARRLKGINFFVKPKLLWKDRLIVKALISVRYELTQIGFQKHIFRIRDLKLYCNAHLIDSSSPIQEIIN